MSKLVNFFLTDPKAEKTEFNLALLLTRVFIGYVFFFHGAQKLFAWFGGYGIEGTAGFFEKIGIPFPVFNVYLAGGTEFFGGLLLILGIKQRLIGVPLAFTMLVAGFTAHSGFAAQTGGMEYPLTLAVISLALALLGPGDWSLAGLLNRDLTRVQSANSKTQSQLSAVPA